ncbi:MAG: hypothetical protein RLZZ210_1478 [Pseudomonadota bacterium]|jgi:hypothetical protein
MKLENCPDLKQIEAFYTSNKVFTIKSLDVFINTVNTLYDIACIADRIIPIKAYLDLVRHNQQEAGASICLDDEFLAACNLLNLEVSLFSAVYFMRGISVDFKETKFNRNSVDILSTTILADLRHKLSKPNEIRGAVESNTIQTCYARLVRRINLHKRSGEIIKRIQFGISKQEVMREFALTLTDFELVYRIAQRENMIKPGIRKRETEMRYMLGSDNHSLLQEYAEHTKLPAQEVLNDIVEKFFMQLNKKKSKKDSMEKSENA